MCAFPATFEGLSAYLDWARIIAPWGDLSALFEDVAIIKIEATGHLGAGWPSHALLASIATSF